MTEEYSYDYAQWLENTLLNVLASGKNLSSKKIIKKLETKRINCHEKFIEALDKIEVRRKIISKLPLLNTYPIDLLADSIYEEDIEKINEWEIEILTKSIIELEKQFKNITPDIYYDFFDKEIKPYKEYFLDETYEKTLPENMRKYWTCRVDMSISWEESTSSNIEINTTACLESEYFKIENDILSFNKLLNINPEEY